MKARAIAIVGLTLSLGLTLGTPALCAEVGSAETMAAILIDLNHLPTDAQKKTLQAIVDDGAASEQEQAVATAMINLQHKATAADKTKLSKIMSDSAASADTRDLAKIIHNLSHMPSGDDKARLKKML